MRLSDGKKAPEGFGFAISIGVYAFAGALDGDDRDAVAGADGAVGQGRPMMSAGGLVLTMAKSSSNSM